MNSTNACPRCGRPASINNQFCAGCGSNLTSTSGRIGWKVFFGAFALLVGVLWTAAIYTQTRPTGQLSAISQPQALTGTTGDSSVNSSSALATQSPTSLTLTSAQHLAEAKRALADGYKPNKDIKKAQWGEVAAAKWHIRAIGSAAPEYREAQELLKEVAKREKQIELASKQSEYESSASSGNTGADGNISSKSTVDDYASETPPPASASQKSTSTSGAAAAARQSMPEGGAAASGTSSDDYYTNSRGLRVHRPVMSQSGPPAGATAQCGDGSYSFSMSRRGTCSHHGGVSRWL